MTSPAFTLSALASRLWLGRRGEAVWALGLIGSLLTGCQQPAPTRSPAPPTQPAHPTYNEHVAPILFEHCATCHRPLDPTASPAGIPQGPSADPVCVAGAPFSVLDYRAVQPRAAAIAGAVGRRAMPPWLPEPAHGDFVNERRLRDDQIALIQAWASDGAPEGDAATRPATPRFPSGWQLGEPHLVLTADEAYTLPAKSGETFRTFVLRVPPGPVRYVRGIEFRADNLRVLHHANVGVDPRRLSRRLDRADPGPGFANMPEDQVQDVFGWSPGKVPVMEPADTAWTLEEGADLVVQLHMVPSDKPETVRPSVGLFFSDTPPTRVPMVVKLESKAIDIPAGQADYAIEDSYTLPADVDLVSVYPHAHYLGRTIEGSARRPDGTVVPLLRIASWNVRWQDQYRYRAPVPLPKGTTLRMRITYDNSAANRNNPAKVPTRVRWGPLSTDEMGALWLEVVPRRAGDVALLTRDYYARALLADVAAAELRLKGDSSSAVARNALATKYLQAGRTDEAVTQLEQALRLQPADAEAHSNLGTALQQQGQIGAAMQHLREAVRLAPGDDRVRFNLGNALFAAGQLLEATREFRRAIELNPDNEDAHFNLAMIVGPQNQLDEAVALLRRVIELNPQNADAHRNLAVALGLQGRLDEAIERDRTALRLAGASPETTAHLAQLLQARAASGRR